MITPEKLLESAKELETQLRTWRRTLHRHPEVGFDLTQTKALVKKALTEMGYECKEYAFTDSNDIASVAQLATECDVMYIPTDNTAASYTETIANVVLPAKVPAVVGEEGICKGCGVATLTISYYDIGYATGEMAYEILVNGADVSTMPIQSAPKFTKKYNAANAAELGLTIPEGYEAIEE